MVAAMRCDNGSTAVMNDVFGLWDVTWNGGRASCLLSFIFGTAESKGPGQLPAERPKWKLAFQVPPKFPIITGEKIRDANGNPLEVILVDTVTGEPSSALKEALRIELVPLFGNFPRHSWDTDDFQRGIVEAKHPVLAGEYKPTMWDGRATVSELMFTDDSLKCGCMFRVGVRVVPDSYHGTRILEGMTKAFMVRDRHGYELHRSKNYKWQLAFQSQPRLPIHAGQQVRDVIGNPLEVILVDAETGLLSAPPEMELHIKLVALQTDKSHWDDWSADEFQRAVFKPGRGSGAYLSSDVNLTIKDDGRVTVNQLQFTGTTPFMLCHGYIGVCVVPGSYDGLGTIREGMTKSFTVQNEVMKMKSSLPDLDDEVWRLRGISWGGVLHRKLTQNNVRNVQDFLRMLAAKPEELSAIVGDDMDDSTWSEIIDHARTCVVPGDKVYAYSTAHATIYVDSVFDLVKVELAGVEWPLQPLDEAQKGLVQLAMQQAYEDCHSFQEVKLTWKLVFKSQPRLPINVGSKIEDATGNPLEIILVDAETGSPTALPMDIYIRLVPLLGDFPPYENWSAEEFQTAIVRNRDKYMLLQAGMYSLKMSDGRATVPEELYFRHDSSWVRCGKFRIGAYAERSGNYDSSFRIVEAMTEAFVVGDVNQKHYPPDLGDPVWRLNMIDKDGVAHRKLTSNNVDTVQEFARMLYVKPDELRAIVGDAMTDVIWRVAAGHVKINDWIFSKGKVYAYSTANSTIYVDSIFCRLRKIEIDGVECQLKGFFEDEPPKAEVVKMMIARQIILEAYEHRHKLQEVDAAMELLDGFVCYIETLLSCTKRYVQVDLDDHNDHYRYWQLIAGERFVIENLANN
ncbi:hypothetical protein EJB05_26072, partial [Eragrostis curvula]